MSNIPMSKEETIEVLTSLIGQKRIYIDFMEDFAESQAATTLDADEMESVQQEIEVNKMECEVMIYALAYLEGKSTIPDTPKTKGKPKLHLVN